MKPETREKFLKLTPGECLTIPWAEIPKTFGRPKKGATVGIGDRVFTMEPDLDGLLVTRTK